MLLLASSCSTALLGSTALVNSPARSTVTMNEETRDSSGAIIMTEVTRDGRGVTRLDNLLESTQAYANVEDAIAADRRKALADANSGRAYLPPHEQLGLDPRAQARYDYMLEESYELCRQITAHP